MQKTTLIILLVMASLCSGLALSHENFCAGSIFQFIASMYAPSDPRQNDRVMTFGEELRPKAKTTNIPQPTCLK